MRTLCVTALICAAALAGAAHAQDPNASQAQELSNCAGAIAAHANLDPLTFQPGAGGEWGQALARVLEALNREEAMQGMTGRYAASAARTHWAEQPRAAREAAANQCRANYGSS